MVILSHIIFKMTQERLVALLGWNEFQKSVTNWNTENVLDMPKLLRILSHEAKVTGSNIILPFSYLLRQKTKNKKL